MTSSARIFITFYPSLAASRQTNVSASSPMLKIGSVSRRRWADGEHLRTVVSVLGD
jgi:hypothetical protein